MVALGITFRSSVICAGISQELNLPRRRRAKYSAQGRLCLFHGQHILDALYRQALAYPERIECPLIVDLQALVADLFHIQRDLAFHPARENARGERVGTCPARSRERAQRRMRVASSIHRPSRTIVAHDDCICVAIAERLSERSSAGGGGRYKELPAFEVALL